jgi:hypothetical protein
VFKRSSSDDQKTAPPSASDAEAGRPGGTGRPTPTRREAEAARKARAKAPQNRREAQKLARKRRAQQSARAREAMRTGDERYLPARDQGKVRRFVRDRIDSRLCMAEFLLPLLLIIMVLQYSGNPALQKFSNGLWTATILLLLVDTGLVVFRLRRDLRSRFAGEDTKGAVLYGVLRSLQLRFLRLPKPQVKLGQKLPDHY